MKVGSDKLQKDFDIIRILKYVRSLRAAKTIIFTRNQNILLDNVPYVLKKTSKLSESLTPEIVDE
jgi:hypothetical protein